MEKEIKLLRKLELSKSFKLGGYKFEKGEIVEQIQTPVSSRRKGLYIQRDNIIFNINPANICYVDGKAKEVI